MRILSLAASLLILAGCATSPGPTTRVSNNETSGNLAITKNIDCLTKQELKSSLTPPDLYGSMVGCIRAGRDLDATYLFALAGVYTTYDTYRVGDASAHQAHSILARIAREDSDPMEYNRFFESLKATIGTPSGLLEVCEYLDFIGPPDYHPSYMIQHGIEAFLKNQGSGLLSNASSTSSLQKAKDKYLHCPAS